VLLEEIGHSVDARLNVTDSPGDEGAIFAAVVQGKTFDGAYLASLKAEDDSETIHLNAKEIQVEQAHLPDPGLIELFIYRVLVTESFRRCCCRYYR
jgi:hypothetical protein